MMLENIWKFHFVLLYQVIKMLIDVLEILTLFWYKTTKPIISSILMMLPKMELPKKLNNTLKNIKSPKANFCLFKIMSHKELYRI